MPIDPDKLTSEDFSTALEGVSLSDADLSLLVTHYEAPQHTITPRDMARCLGFSSGAGANGAYGSLAKKLGSLLGESPGDWIYLLATFATKGFGGREEETAWRMRPALVRALEEAGMVATTSGSAPKRNPPWSRDELILALDVYMRHRHHIPGKASQPVMELSDLLASLGRSAYGATFRNPSGVYMKLMNFRRFDPQYTQGGKSGLTRGNRDEAAVWERFAGKPAELELVARAIRSALSGSERLTEEEPGIEEAEEGRLLTRLHRVRERDKRLVAEAKRQAREKLGKLSCEACDFNFGEAYGPTLDGLVEVHHTKPLHTLGEGGTTRIGDLAILCANCHRVVHSRRAWLTIMELRALVEAHRHPAA